MASDDPFDIARSILGMPAEPRATPPTPAAAPAALDINALAPLVRAILRDELSGLMRETTELVEALRMDVRQALGDVAKAQANVNISLTTDVLSSLANLRQSVHAVARLGATRRPGPIRVVFLVHHIEAWDALRDVAEAMAADPDFEPIIASIPRDLTSSQSFGGEETVHAELERMGTPHIRFRQEDPTDDLDILKALAPDIIFRQSPWEKDVPPPFRAQEINFARICYVPYGFMTAKMEKLQTAQPFHAFCWRIFCETEAHRAMYADAAPHVAGKVRVSGYPKFDRLVKASTGEGRWPIERATRGLRVIYAPHHAITRGWLGFGTFLESIDPAIAFARAHPDVEIVMKPHPALFALCVSSGLMPAPQLEARLAAWRALPNAAIVEGADYGPLMAASDAMITDGVSFFSEYQLFDKPIVFLDSQRHIGFNPAGERLLKGMIHATSFADAAQAVLLATSPGGDTLAAARREVRAELLPYPGEAARRILDILRAEL